VNVRVLHQLSTDGVNVRLVVGHTVVGNRVLAITGQSSAVTVRQVVDHKNTGDRRVGASLVLGLNVGQVGSHCGHLGGNVATAVRDSSEYWDKKTTYSQTNEGTLATALALGWSELGREGMARDWTSEE
jgi:hypothetical protein